jgi:ribonucleoside-diphosphate reductase alpha chain
MDTTRGYEMTEKTIYEELSEERKRLQLNGDLPDWFITPGWQLIKEKYLTDTERDVKSMFRRIAKHAAKYMEWDDSEKWEEIFFNLFWDGDLAGSTPVLANFGTDRGCPVSCSGSYDPDSIFGFYDTLLELAVLTKHGFGVSAYLGDIRPRGEPISSGGKASGVLPVITSLVQMTRDVSQGSQRRGSGAWYIDIESDDFFEVVTFLKNNPDDCNIGWNVHDSFMKRMDEGDQDALDRYQTSLVTKLITGKGYYHFVDKVNRQNPPMYKHLGLDVKASNLCAEISLHSSPTETFICTLSSMNCARYDVWKHTNGVFNATVFLDCITQSFIDVGKNIPKMEKAVRFAEKSRAIGLGLLGFHSYLQQSWTPFESFEAHQKNNEIFKHLHDESLRASKWLAENLGEPEWCKGFGVRHTHRTAIAPNMSSALICGGYSQGIEPIYKNIFVQSTAGGDVNRVNPILLQYMKDNKLDTKKNFEELKAHQGSTQKLDWLPDHVKEATKTAFEIDQMAILRLASARQRWICQSQSLNLFFSADEDEEYISQIHQHAFKDERIKSLYYIRSESGVEPSKGECVACEG